MTSKYGVMRWESGKFVPYGQQPNVEPPPTTTIPAPELMLVGCSTSNNSHGGTEKFPLWRTYTEGDLYNYSARTDGPVNMRPKAFLYSKDGGLNLGGATATYANVLVEATNDLEDYYYTTRGGTTRSPRWGIQLVYVNGNENSDKGALTLPHSPAGISRFVDSQHALYDAVHAIDPVTGQRRYPDAFAGTNPTQFQEQNNQVADWLGLAAPYIDVLPWSMYNPGRGKDAATSADPTMNWPSFVELDRTNLTKGFLYRCFWRTKWAQDQAQTVRPGHRIAIAAGEYGTGDTPGDPDARPYYTVMGYLEGMMRLSTLFGLWMFGACYWDNQKKLPDGSFDPNAPQNRLEDEPAAFHPTTVEAMQGHLLYNPLRINPATGLRGAKPARWVTPATPRTAWKHTGNPI